MRLGFMGSPPFAAPVLESIAASSHEIVLLVTPPDRPRGRGRKSAPSELAERARSLGAAVLQPETTKTPDFAAAVAAHEPDVLVVASYGEILREDILGLAPHGALNVHASLLPRWRGASPIQAAILAGDAETGVSVQRMVLALDEGDVLLARSTPIDADENAGELLARLALLGGEAAVAALDAIEAGEATYTPQSADDATFARKLTKDHGLLDWTEPAEDLARRIRAVTPWPGARTHLADGKPLGILRARVTQDSGAPGTLLAHKGAPLVACGNGALELTEVKPAGKGAMDGAAFQNGARLEPGTKLGS